MSQSAIDTRIDNEQVSEFGGPLGAVAIMVGSHLLLYWLWIAWRFEDGARPLPEDLADLGPFAARMVDHVVSHAAPTWEAVALYCTFLLVQARTEE